MSEAITKATDEQIRKTVESIQDPDTVPAFHNGYYTLTPDELRRSLLALRPQAVPMTLPPVEGDVLPAIGSKVLIHLASSDSWAEHEVVGYYVWEAINDLAKPRHHRVFVRVRDADGILNAHHNVHHGITAKAEGGA